MKSPKQLRHTFPRVCATCRFLEPIKETFQPGSIAQNQCSRPGGPSFDDGEDGQWLSVCDRWARKLRVIRQQTIDLGDMLR